MSTWTEKYRPRSLRDLVGNPAAVSELERWALAWQKGDPDRRAAILYGPPGTGKTSAALALAADMGWTVVEMNASDKRNAEAVRGTALRGALTQTFSSTGEFLTTARGGRKLLLLDEADNLLGREDSGGIGAIVETIRATGQPVILIANDYYGLTRRSSALKGLSRSIHFQTIHPSSVKTVLTKIAKDEGVTVPEPVIDYIAEHADGDLRSAVNDLELVARGEVEITPRSLDAIGRRDRESTVYDALGVILRTQDARRARDSARSLDESPEDLVLWIDENLPADYRQPDDLQRAYRALSRADIYLARAGRRKQYGLWAYASEMMTAGVALARRGRYGGGRYGFPMWLVKQSRSRARRAVRASLAGKLGRRLHTSRNVVLIDVLPSFKFLYANDGDFKLATTIDLGLDEREVAFLLDEKEDSHAVRHLMERAAKVRGTEEEPTHRHLPEGAEDEGSEE